MFFAYTAALISVFVALADAAALPASTKCHTIDSGFLSAFIGRRLPFALLQIDEG